MTVSDGELSIFGGLMSALQYMHNFHARQKHGLGILDIV